MTIPMTLFILISMQGVILSTVNLGEILGYLTALCKDNIIILQRKLCELFLRLLERFQKWLRSEVLKLDGADHEAL